jgi:hypothetical protein
MFLIFFTFALAFDEVSKKEEFCLFIVKQAGTVRAGVFSEGLKALGKEDDKNALEKIKQMIFQKCLDDDSFDDETVRKDAEFIKEKTIELSPDLQTLINNQNWIVNKDLSERIFKLEDLIQKKYSAIRMNAFRASRAYREENSISL